MTLYSLFWVILIIAVIGIAFWYLKSRKKGGEVLPPTPPAPEPEEEKKEGPEV